MRLDGCGAVDLQPKFFDWISGDLSWAIRMPDPPEIICAIAATDEQWTVFGQLAQRALGITRSEEVVK
jgi:hypothetical protein